MITLIDVPAADPQTRLKVLQEVFLDYAKQYYDASAASLVRAVLDAAVSAEHGTGYVASDFACLTRAQKAVEMLNLLPQSDMQNKKELPETRYALWRAIVCGMIEGSVHTPKFAQVLLKKAVLTENERKRLRDCLKDVFEHISFLEVRQSLFWALQKVTRKSEDIVVRGILQAIARLADAEDLTRLFAR